MDKYKLGEVYHGFKLTEMEDINDIHSAYKIFTHEKSGAQLFYLSNDDNNKVFDISFKTPPKSSNGIAHIMEHSVLCGSKNYPVKDPFMSLVSSSLNTFLNAMTFSDKTMYPFASQNDKDFMNLLGIYLDAVFYPNLLNDSTILHQEGWHYHLESEKENLGIRGVVYGEMQGAFSSPESVLYSENQRSLFPDTCYAYDSGGIPENIPELTQEEFVEFHQNYYHPSNAKIYLYGNGNIDEHLKFIDEKYLSNFDRIEINPEIELQKPFAKAKEKVVNYPIPLNAPTDNQYYISLNYATEGMPESKDLLAMEILKSCLFDLPSSPLRKAINKANIAMDFGSQFDSFTYQPYFSVFLKKCSIDVKEKFIEIVETELQKLVKDGIDKELLKSAISKKEFQLREADFRSFPKGLFYALNVINQWNYDFDPVTELRFEDDLKFIWDNISSGYFEKLLERLFLSNTHQSILILQPEPGLAEKKSAALKSDLSALQESWDDAKIKEVIKQTSDLQTKQNTPDSPEALAKMSVLELSDIKTEARKLPLQESEISGVKTLLHNVNANGIGYLNLFFDLQGLNLEELKHFSLLTALLGNLDTENYSYSELSNQINIFTGGISFSEAIYAKIHSQDYVLKHTINGKVLMKNFAKLLKLIEEIILHTKFADKNKIYEIIKSQKSAMDSQLLRAGHAVAITRLMSYYNEHGKLNDELKNIGYLQFLNNILDDFENKFEQLQAKLIAIFEKVYSKTNLIISFSAEEEDLAQTEPLQNFIDKLPNHRLSPVKLDLDVSVKNEAIPTAANVQYVAQGFDFKKLGFEYDGALMVINTAFSVDYLIQKIRVMGGAYGAFGNMNITGESYFASYRDPNLAETLQVFQNLPEYLKGLKMTKRMLTNFIIATIGKIDKPLTPSMIGLRAAIHYLTGMTQEDIQANRNQIINFDESKLAYCIELLEKGLQEKIFCVVGNAEKIAENESLFSSKLEL